MATVAATSAVRDGCSTGHPRRLPRRTSTAKNPRRPRRLRWPLPVTAIVLWVHPVVEALGTRVVSVIGPWLDLAAIELRRDDAGARHPVAQACPSSSAKPRSVLRRLRASAAIRVASDATASPSR